jgi:Undecaprenyl pyrophosphate synthase
MHLSRLRNWFLASPPIEFAINSLKELLVGALRQGPIPQHVAFVMDGNRRFARSHGIETVEGHNLGFEALARVCSSGSAASSAPVLLNSGCGIFALEY